MELGQRSTVQAEAPAATRRRLGGTDEEFQKLLKIVAKLALSSAMQSRILRAVTLQCFKISSKNVFVTAALAATKGYSEKSKEIGKGDRVGQMHHPHTHVWNAWIKIVKGRVKEGAEAAMLQAYTAKLEGLGPLKGLQEIGKGCKYARITKMYDQQFKRLEVNLRDFSEEANIWEACVLPVLLKEGATQMEGVAPPGDLERRIQDILQELEPQQGV